MLPTVADVLALEPVRRGAPRVLAGQDRLTAPVRWVHVIELTEAGRLLRGGELVLSTGIALPPDPDGLARYVAGLAAAGVSALAVELGSRYLRELPAALVTAATVHDLPLIVLERETQFIAITEAVHAQILDAQVAELRAAQRLDQVLTDLAMAGASQDEIVSRAAVLAGAPVILADLGHRVLACAPAGQDLAALLAGFAARSRAVAVPGGGGYDPVARWLVAPVRAAGAPGGDWGRLIFVLTGPPDPAVTVLAERTAVTLALARLAGEQRGYRTWRTAERPWPQRSAHGSVLAALAAAGHADARELAARIAALGVPLAGPGTPAGRAGPRRGRNRPRPRPRPRAWPASGRTGPGPRDGERADRRRAGGGVRGHRDPGDRGHAARRPGGRAAGDRARRRRRRR